jgi:aminoglycoside phosphotransferase (APT) family kinase protein
VREQLTAWLRDRVGDEVRIEGLESVEFGHSAEMFALTMVTAAGRRDVVLRLRPTPPALLEPYDLARQFRVLTALAPTEVRVPPVLWHEPTGDVLGRPFFVMDRVAGEVYELQAPDATVGQIRTMCAGIAEQLAAVHRVDVAAVGLAELADGDTHLARDIDHWAAEIDRVRRGPLPALDKLVGALRAAMPEPCPAVTLVHGDAKPGNFAFVEDRVSAVFDWEMVTLGDPLTDLGWLELMWMQPVGIPSHPDAYSIDELLADYTSASDIATQHRPWYRALAAYKMSAICLIGAMLYADGASTDERYALNAHGIPMLTKLGLAELGITEEFEDGPILAR